jgi:hypothetical protein
MFLYYVELLIGERYAVRPVLSLLTYIFLFANFYENFAKLHYDVL